MRRCYGCDLTHSHYDFWYLNKGTDLVLCAGCYDSILRRPKRFKTRQEFLKWASECRKGWEPPNKGIHNVDKENRECYCCGSTKTWISKDGRRHWAINKDQLGNTIGVLCKLCNTRLIVNAKYNPIKSKQVINFLGKPIHLGYDPRTHVCSICGNSGLTHLHHEKYNESKPLDHTIELCPSCHSKETWKTRKRNT